MKKSLVVLFCVLVLTMGLTAGGKVCAFPLCLKIGTGDIGAKSFTAHLIVNPFHDKMTGYGKIFQPVSPPLNIDLQLKGHYCWVCFLGQTLNVVHLTGYQELHTTTGTLKVIKARASMLLAGWHSGVCSYKYMDDSGKWIKVKSVPVKSFPCFPLKVGKSEDGAKFWAYISPMNDTAKYVTKWKVSISQGNWAGSITWKNPTENLATPNLSGIFKVKVTASGPKFKEKELTPLPGTKKGVIGCNLGCYSMVGIVANKDGTDANYWTVWDAICN
jgi:hypothetical protein